MTGPLTIFGSFSDDTDLAPEREKENASYPLRQVQHAVPRLLQCNVVAEVRGVLGRNVFFSGEWETNVIV